jgi:hypothetical protein
VIGLWRWAQLDGSAVFNGGWAEGEHEDASYAIDNEDDSDDELEERSHFQLRLDDLGEDEVEPDEDFEAWRYAASDSMSATPVLAAMPLSDSRESSATVEQDRGQLGDGAEAGSPGTGMQASSSDDTLSRDTFSTPKSPRTPATAPRRTRSVRRPASPQRRARITVTDCSYEAYFALLCWLYTDVISFRPLNSVYFANRLAVPVQPHSGSTLADFQRHAAISTQLSGLNGKRLVPPCSAKAIYTLADSAC